VSLILEERKRVICGVGGTAKTNEYAQTIIDTMQTEAELQTTL
jgi:hypothetical protein